MLYYYMYLWCIYDVFMYFYYMSRHCAWSKFKICQSHCPSDWMTRCPSRMPKATSWPLDHSHLDPVDGRWSEAIWRPGVSSQGRTWFPRASRALTTEPYFAAAAHCHRPRCGNREMSSPQVWKMWQILVWVFYRIVTDIIYIYIYIERERESRYAWVWSI